MLMNRLARRFRLRGIENPAVPLSSAKIIEYLGGASTSTAGEIVNDATAMKHSPVWQAVSLISGDISRLPFLVYERTADGKERAVGHPAYRLLRRSTGELTPNRWVQAMLHSALLKGNGFSWIRRSGGGYPVELVWISPERVELKRRDGALYYEVRNSDADAAPERVAPEDMFHLAGLAPDGMLGLSLVAYAKESIGRALAIERYGSEFFSNGAVPQGWFTHPSAMSQEAVDRFIAAVQARHGGAGNRRRFGVLEEGMGWESSGVTPEEALLVDSMAWGVKDVARWFNLPPHKLGDDSRTSYNSVEQENRAYFDGTLCQWISRLEYEANDKLFSSAEKLGDTYFAEFLVDALLRGDAKTRAEVYKSAVEGGWMTRNEVRTRENMNRAPGLDEFLVPLNMGTADEEGDEEDGEEEARGGQEPQRVAAIVGAHRDLLASRLEDVARRVHRGAAHAAKCPRKLGAWLDALRDRERSVVIDMLRPTVQAIYTASGRGEAAEAASQRLVDRLLEQVAGKYLAASECQPEDLLQRVRDAQGGVFTAVRTLANEMVAEDIQGDF